MLLLEGFLNNDIIKIYIQLHIWLHIRLHISYIVS